MKQDKTAADWLKVDAKLNDWTKQHPGFRFRSLSESQDGEWIDMVYWESLEAAQASGARFRQEMGAIVQPLIAPESLVISLSTVHVMQEG